MYVCSWSCASRSQQELHLQEDEAAERHRRAEEELSRLKDELVQERAELCTGALLLLLFSLERGTTGALSPFASLFPSSPRPSGSSSCLLSL